MEKILYKPWEYTLFEMNNNYLLEVLCGGVGVYQIKIWLNDYEKECFLKQGSPYIDKLSKYIQSNPKSFKDRSV